MCEGVAAAKKSILSGCCTIEASMTGIQDFDDWVVFMAGFGGNHVYIYIYSEHKNFQVQKRMNRYVHMVFQCFSTCVHTHAHTHTRQL